MSLNMTLHVSGHVVAHHALWRHSAHVDRTRRKGSHGLGRLLGEDAGHTLRRTHCNSVKKSAGARQINSAGEGSHLRHLISGIQNEFWVDQLVDSA